MTPDTDTDTDTDTGPDPDGDAVTPPGSTVDRDGSRGTGDNSADGTAADGIAADGIAADGAPTAPHQDRPADGLERCPYCGRPLRDAGVRALHVGEVHDDVWTETEREAYERAREAETDALFRYHVKVVGALVILIFGLVYTYVFVLA